MPGYSQRVKGAVLTAPYLLPKLKSQLNANDALIGRIITRLIPYRSSVEIEHMPIYMNEFYRKMLPIQHAYFSKNEPIGISYDIDFMNDALETTISLLDLYDEIPIDYNACVSETKLCITPKISKLIMLHKALKTLGSISTIATNGSLHVHIDITKWMREAYTSKLYRYIGIIIITNSANPQICKAVDEFLTEASAIFNWVPTTRNFDFKRGVSRRVVNKRYSYGGHAIGNVRNIGYESLAEIRDNRLYRLGYSDKFINKSIKEQRRQYGIIPNCGKFNWVNFRQLPDNNFTLEYRLGDCTFDYAEIIQYIIDCNRLTKRFLNYIDKIGQLAIGVDNFASFFK